MTQGYGAAGKDNISTPAQGRMAKSDSSGDFHHRVQAWGGAGSSTLIRRARQAGRAVLRRTGGEFDQRARTLSALVFTKGTSSCRIASPPRRR